MPDAAMSKCCWQHRRVQDKARVVHGEMSGSSGKIIPFVRLVYRNAVPKNELDGVTFENCTKW